MKFNPYSHFGFLTNRVARLISRSAHQSIKDDGYQLPTSCIGVLADLWSQDGVNQKDLGVSLVKTKSSINKMLQDLERDNLITKQDNPSDGRGKLIFLTGKGRSMQTTIENHNAKLDSYLEQSFTVEEIATAKEVLSHLYDHLCDRAYKEYESQSKEQ